MAGPLGGIGAGQQIPLSSPLQSGQNNQQVREQDDRQPQENRVQPQNTATAQTQQTETGNFNAPENDQNNAQDAQQAISNQREQERGSLVDISV